MSHISLAHRGLSNDRLRNQIGDISLVAENRRVSGSGATYVMAPFTHINVHGTRFSNGSFGIYYAGKEFNTALRETIFHMENFYRATRDNAHAEDFRVLIGAVDSEFFDIRDGYPELHDPVDYTASKDFGLNIHKDKNNGIVYRSVRNPGGEAVAAFWPDVVGIPIQSKHLKYHWDGSRINKYYDYLKKIWMLL